MSESEPDVNNNIDTGSRSTVYCTALAEGHQAEWDFLWARYLGATSANEQSTILRALGCTKEVWILQVREENPCSSRCSVLR